MLRTKMPRQRSFRKASFLWQAALIVFPVLVLATVGVFSLRQDRILAEIEARERAQTIADGLAEGIWEQFTTQWESEIQNPVSTRLNLSMGNCFFFKVSLNGKLLYPPAFSPVMNPQPFDPTELSEEQARLWRTARTAEFSGTDPEVFIAAYSQFIDSEPPEKFAAAARFALGLALQPRELQQSAEMFEMIVTKYSKAVSESGLPLSLLARLKLNEMAIRAADQMDSKKVKELEQFCADSIYHPTPLTPYLLKTVTDWERELRLRTGFAGTGQDVWKTHEVSRKLYQAARSQFRSNPMAALASMQFKFVKAPSPRDIRVFHGRNILPNIPPITIQPSAWSEPTNLAASGNPTAGPGDDHDDADNRLVPNVFWFRTENWDSPASNYQVTAAPKPSAPAEVNLFSQDWLAIASAHESPGLWLFCRPESEVRWLVDQLANRNRNVPDYFGVSVDLAGKRLTDDFDLRTWREVYHGGKTGGITKEFLDPKSTSADIIATARKFENGNDFLKVSIHLTSPTTLFARQRARTFWFGALIVASAAAGLVGLAAAWWSFNRQQKLNEMKSNFVSSVSHELRAPIASVRLMAEGLQSGRVKEETKQAEYFRFIVQECRRLSALIENVLNFSRIEQGRKQYEFEPTDLLTLAQQTVRLMEPYAAERQITLALSLNEPQPPPLNSPPILDGRAIQQALV
ncbi:MAG: HAMP domain-containing sensor histidine kinase, partial [Verrucomicrobiota bacterium]